MRCLFSFVLLFSSSGCLGAVVWPVADITPPVIVGSSPEVRAYRREVTTSGGWFCTLGGDPKPVDVLFEVPVLGDRIERQANCKLDWFLGLILLGAYERHDLKIVLDRPGYKSVEVDSWPWWFALGYAAPHPIEWTPYDPK